MSALTSSLNNSFSAMDEMLSDAQVIAWSCALALEAVFIFLGNLLTIVLSTFNKKLRNKKSLYLVMNMAFADLVWGGASLPLFVYLVTATRSRLYFTEFPTFLQIIFTVSSMASFVDICRKILRRFLAAEAPNTFHATIQACYFDGLDIGYLIFYGLYIAFPLESASCFRFRYFIRLVTNCNYLRPQHRYLEKDSAKICFLLPKQTNANPAFDESPVISICWYLEFLDPRNYFLFVKTFRSKHIFKHSPFHLFYPFFQFFYQSNGVRIKNF